jgi:hypothetical protein
MPYDRVEPAWIIWKSVQQKHWTPVGWTILQIINLSDSRPDYLQFSSKIYRCLLHERRYGAPLWLDQVPFRKS